MEREERQNGRTPETPAGLPISAKYWKFGGSFREFGGSYCGISAFLFS
jgi:hypothetical protein